MRISFTYDLKKDTENFLKSFNSTNSKKPTKLQELYVSQTREVEPSKVSEFLEKKVLDVSKKLKQIELNWKAIEVGTLARMGKLFGISLVSDITVYLSTNSRCTYNIKENYFFVYMDSQNPCGIIVHELMHFYTWHVFYEKLQEKGISPDEYNDIKESLSELINTDFQDLLGTYYDKGYPQHLAMRKKINSLRKEGKSIVDIVNSLY